MKKLIVIYVALFFFLASSAHGEEMYTQDLALEFEWQINLAQKEKKNIKDYFMLLPMDFLDCEHMRDFDERFAFKTTKKREALITKLDERNGYLEFGASQLVLFKDRKNKKDIIAIQVGGCGAGNTCGAANSLMELDGTNWKYRTDLLPQRKTLDEIYHEEVAADTACPYFVLPQYGTDITIMNEWHENNGQPEAILGKFLWNGERFITGTQ